MSDYCEACGFPDAKPTTTCPRCGKMRCETCDMGVGTVCGDCETRGGSE